METYGDLKKAINTISLKQKGAKIGNVALDAVLGAIPGIGTAKSTFDFVKAAFLKPDTKKSNSWLDKLDIDDEMSSIVDDTVENGFLKMISTTIDSETDTKPLEQDFNMNSKMVTYLKNNYSGRTVSGIKEQKSVFDKFFTKFAYKFDKGYPDMNNTQDVLLLESLLSEVIGEKFSLKETNLSRSQLKKYESRVRKFVQQILDQTPFETVDGEVINVTSLVDGNTEFNLQSDEQEMFDSIFSNQGTLLVKGNIDDKDVTLNSNKLKKTASYGGRGAGSGTKVEDAALADAVFGLNKLNDGKAVDISFNGVIYNDIVTATTVPKTPKADFSFDNSEGERVIYLSHKAGSKARDFQQYGGVTAIANHPEVESFVSAVKENLQDPNQMEPGRGFRRKVEDPELIRKVVYGLDFQSKENYGINNVQGLLQGPLKFTKISKENTDEPIYELSSNHTILNPNLPEGEYEAYFYVTMRRNRNQFGIKDARFGVYTEAFKRNSLEI